MFCFPMLKIGDNVEGPKPEIAFHVFFTIQNKYYWLIINRAVISNCNVAIRFLLNGHYNFQTLMVKEVIFVDVFIYILTLETYGDDDSVTAHFFHCLFCLSYTYHFLRDLLSFNMRQNNRTIKSDLSMLII